MTTMHAVHLGNRTVVEERTRVFRAEKVDRRLRIQALQPLDEPFGETVFIPTKYLTRAGVPSGRQSISLVITEFKDGSVLSQIIPGADSGSLPDDLRALLNE